MKIAYDSYYQTEHLFGEPYPELLQFYSAMPNKGALLDLGCGQGRDAIALARLGFSVTGIDHSKVGINQLHAIAEKEHLPLIGLVADIYSYSDFDKFEYILLDSMFHFGKKERAQEIGLLDRIIEESTLHAVVTICIRNTGKKLAILNSVISSKHNLAEVHRSNLLYTYNDKDAEPNLAMPYTIIALQKTA